MSRYLLDTHTFLWAVFGPRNFELSARAKGAIEDVESELYVSSASIFEIATKYRIGKIPEYQPVAENILEVVSSLGAKELPLDWKQADLAGNMVWEHKDPFDRILAAQAQTEALTLITCDRAFDELPEIAILW